MKKLLHLLRYQIVMNIVSNIHYKTINFSTLSVPFRFEWTHPVCEFPLFYSRPTIWQLI
jgi:hypothetical protein